MVELLSPAGDKACFMAAISAGADAIYVGGNKYGARAYAPNFSEEELIECIHIAHLFQKKVYLTVNTLMKENELCELPSFLAPYYEIGLDGVIVQDFGALQCIKETFPDLELHASTQMTVTGDRAANLLKQYGVSRVVPARELSLEEIKNIKEMTGLEIETFIHGAMCYGYSGQCLFSTCLGSRSGNRGRCAGPCRLPYDVQYKQELINSKNERYPLSLKDLCVLDILPELLEAGIDSFKIEGRMKTPEYVSFVTGIYRKYIDLYYQEPEKYHVLETDRKLLNTKFSRGDMQSGYYFMHNGRKLVTLDKPGYRSFDIEDEKNTIDLDYVMQEVCMPSVSLEGYFSAILGEPIILSVCRAGAPETTVTVSGPIAEAAQKCAATKEDVCKQLQKTGNTVFAFEVLHIEVEDGLFLPNKILNELRRNALDCLQKELLSVFTKRNRTDYKSNFCPVSDVNANALKTRHRYLHIDVTTLRQFFALEGKVNWQRVYLSTDALASCSGDKLSEQSGLYATREKLRQNGIEFYLRFPAVTRQKTMNILDSYRTIFERLKPDGFCVGNCESLIYVQENYPAAKIIGDTGLYVFNSRVVDFYGEHNNYAHILPYELHKKEIVQLLKQKNADFHTFYLPVYGYIPAMESAGCLLKTYGKCQNKADGEVVTLIDRQKQKRMVITHCDRCENTIYNTVPLSLHKELMQIFDMNLSGVVLKFSIESPDEMKKTLHAYEM